MPSRKGMEVSIAVSEAVKLANVDVISAYPITPQTHIVEHLSELVADGELKAAFIPVESEHSALSAAVGAAAVGARAYTATSSQGLALMHEIMFVASSIRMPLVMTVVNRAISAPINIWNDLSDIMAAKGLRLGPAVCHQRPGGRGPDFAGLQNRRRPEGLAAGGGQSGRFYLEPRD